MKLCCGCEVRASDHAIVRPCDTALADYQTMIRIASDSSRRWADVQAFWDVDARLACHVRQVEFDDYDDGGKE